VASALQILSGTFGVKNITPTDPGIIKLAQLRSGTYGGIGNVTITPAQEAAQLLGLAPDPLAKLARSGALDKSSTFLDKTLPNLLLAGSAAVAGFGFGGALGTVASGAIKTAPSLVPTPQPVRSNTMAFSDGDSGFSFDSLFGGINQALQGGLGTTLLGLGQQAATGYINQQFAQPVSYQTNMAAVPAVVGAGRAVATVGRGFFNRFPSLATGIQALRNQGKNVTRANLYSLMKRFGPDFLIGGGILTAAAVSELAMAGPGRRRMNPGNVKALRRAHRRMKSFHHICAVNDRLTGHRRRSKAIGFARGTTITQVK